MRSGFLISNCLISTTNSSKRGQTERYLSSAKVVEQAEFTRIPGERQSKCGCLSHVFLPSGGEVVTDEEPLPLRQKQVTWLARRVAQIGGVVAPWYGMDALSRFVKLPHACT